MNKKIIWLFVLWFFFWGIYNILLLPNGITTENSFWIDFIYLFMTAGVVWISNSMPEKSILAVLVIFIAAAILDLFFDIMLLRRLSNSIFQMVWFYSVFVLLKKDMWKSTVCFGLAHVPAFLVFHLTLLPKVFLVAVAFCGGGYWLE